MTTIENQFDDEPYDQPPDPNKKYWYSNLTKSTGFTHLMKKTLLSNSTPLILTKMDIKEINQQNARGWTALMIACRNSNTFSNQKTVETLINANVDLNMQEMDGWTALILACNNSNTDSKQETVEALIKAGANVNIKGNGGSTALMLACEYSNKDSKQETVEALIKAGADLNITDDDGWTALMWASRYSNTYSKPETVSALIKAGADLNIKSNYGSTALMMACGYSNTDSKQETVGALIKAGADLCYTRIIKLNLDCIYDSIINRHRHNPTKIEPILNHISPELMNKYEYYQRCVTNMKPIADTQTEIYYQPNNIGALLCQTSFESKLNVNYCPHKLLFLFAKN